MKRIGAGALAGCLGVLLLAGLLCAETIPNTLFQEASSLINSAQKIEQENFSEAYRFYKAANEKIEELLAKHPTSKIASQLIQGQLRIGIYSYDELKEKVLPHAKRKADAETDPIEAILLLIERKADEAYLQYALKRIIRIYKRRGQMDKAQEIALTRTSLVDRPGFLMALAFDFVEQGKKKEAFDLLEKAIISPSRPLKEQWERERWGSTLTRVAWAYIRLKEPDRAKALLDQASSLVDSPSLLSQVAAGYANVGESEKAEAAFAKVKGVKNINAAIEVGGSLAHAGRYEEARKMIKEIDIPSYRIHFWVSLFGIATTRGEETMASRFLNEALAEARRGDRSKDADDTARTWLHLARAAREVGELNRALHFLKRAEQSIDAVVGNPSSQRQLLIELAEEYWKSGNPRPIDGLLDRANIKSSIQSGGSNITLAELYARLGKVEQALLITQDFNGGVGQIGAMIQIAAVLWETGNRSQALAILAKAESDLQKADQDGLERHHELVRLASQYAAFGEESIAVRILRDAEKLVPTRGSTFGTSFALIDVAQGYLGIHRPEDAERILSKAIEVTKQAVRQSDRPERYAYIASVYTEGGMFQRAWEVAELIEGNEAEKADAWLQIATKQLAAKQTAQGRERLLSAIALLDKKGIGEDSRFHAQIAAAWMAAGEIDKALRAIDSLDRVVGKIATLYRHLRSYSTQDTLPWPEDSIVKVKSRLKEWEHQAVSGEDWAKLAAIWAKVGDRNEVTEIFSRAESATLKDVSKSRNDFDSLRNIVFNLVELGFPEKAASIADEIRDPSQRIICLSIVIWTLIDQKKTDKAQSLLSKMEEAAKEVTDPSKRSSALLLVARHRIELGEREEGLNLLNQLVASSHPPRESGDEITAASSYLKARERDKGMDLLELALQRVQDEQPGWGKVIDLGERTFPLAEVGEVDGRGQRFLHKILQHAEEIPVYGPSR
ncbi:MAG: hypothetical protein MCM46_00200 [Candidatus Manganitrophus sp. SB1]|nr:hypothetical protein [Candidatus Manganitrophus morganii]